MNNHFFQHRSNSLLNQARSDKRYLIWWSGRIRYSHPWSLETRQYTFNMDWFSKLHGSYYQRLKRMSGAPENRHDKWDERLFGGTPYGDLVIRLSK